MTLSLLEAQVFFRKLGFEVFKFWDDSRASICKDDVLQIGVLLHHVDCNQWPHAGAVLYPKMCRKWRFEFRTPQLPSAKPVKDNLFPSLHQWSEFEGGKHQGQGAWSTVETLDCESCLGIQQISITTDILRRQLDSFPCQPTVLDGANHQFFTAGFVRRGQEPI